MHVISHPAIPFWGRFPEGVHPGTVVHIDGHVPHHADRFEINFVLGYDSGYHAAESSSIALHFNPRVDENTVVLNARHHNSWEHEERHHSYHFTRGSSFSMVIHVEPNGYRIDVNGNYLCTFGHRKPYQEVGHLYVNGCVDIHRVEFRHEYGGGGPYVPQRYVPPTHHHHY